jgi:hypothetical protein
MKADIPLDWLESYLLFSWTKTDIFLGSLCYTESYCTYFIVWSTVVHYFHLGTVCNEITISLIMHVTKFIKLWKDYYV